MRATIEPPIKRKVTIEMTESEAHVLKDLVNHLDYINIDSITQRKLKYDEDVINSLLWALYDALDVMDVMSNK